MFSALPKPGNHAPDSLHKHAHHLELLRIPLRVDLRDLADGSPDLFELALFLVVFVDVLCQGRVGPGEVFVQEAHEDVHVVLEELGKVLTVEVVEDFEQQVQGVRDDWDGGRGVGRRQNLVGTLLD
jgi:hypothetical protein